MKAISMLAATFVLTGCGYLTKPMEHPSFEQHAQQGRINTFGVIPSRRMMIVKTVEDADKKSGKQILICAEAPADVTDNLASTLAASLAASGKAADASAAVTSTLQTVGQSLFKRSQGVQLFRDRSYYLCQARMNGFITDQEYRTSLDAAFKEVIPLIEKELALLEKSQPATAPGQPAQSNVPAASAAAGNTKAEATKEGAKAETPGRARTK